MPEVKLDNSRDPEQRRRMEELIRTGQCHFCREGFENRHSAPIIYEDDNWFISANNFPYAGSVHHFLVVPKTHITRVSELSTEDRVKLFDAFAWLEKYLNTPGEGIFVRSGNMAYTGATLGHLHFQFIVGVEKTGNEPNRLEDMILVPLGYKSKT